MQPLVTEMRGIDGPLTHAESSSTVASCGDATITKSKSQDCLVEPVDDNQLTLDINSKEVVTNSVNNAVTGCTLPKDYDDMSETKCGWGIFQPSCLQRFRSPRWVLFWLCWAGALQGLIVNGFINVVITTIEKRYELKSTESGLIAGSYDIASFLCLIPVSYFGGSRSKPFFIGSGLVLLAIGSLVFSLPHFISGPYAFSHELDYHCNNDHKIINGTCTSDNSSLSNYKYVFLLGQLLHGAGAAPLYTLGCTYLDENVATKMSSVYLGVFYTMAIVGPAIGYVLGGQLLKIYVDVGVSAKELGLTPTSSVWVGAWWIGFVVAAVLGFIIAIPVLAFPKNLPGTEKIKAGKVSEMHQKLQESAAANTGFGIGIRDLPSSFKLLVTNPTFMFLSLAGASEGMLVAGLATFLPKLIESQFSYQASSAAFIVGMVTIPGAGGGNFLGGYLVKKFNLRCSDIIRICILFCLICLGFSFIFILHCPDANFAGLNVQLPNSTTAKFSSKCNANCSCSKYNYDPVCGTDNTIYYSPCFAGCQEIYQQEDFKAYGSCECVQDKGKNTSFGNSLIMVQATREKCSNNCEHGPLFLAVIFFCMFFTFLVSMPSLSATLRCVAESQKSFGLGVQWIAVRVLGTVPAPIIFGWLIDLSCILWQDSCKQQGACLFYSNQTMSTNILIIVCIVKTLSCMFFFIAWYMYQPPATLENEGRTEGESVNQNITSLPTISKRSNDVVVTECSGDTNCVGLKFVQNNNGTLDAIHCTANSSSVF